MVCLGILVNTEDLTLRVPDSRLRDLSDELQLWLSRECFTIKELQSLLGKLSFVTAFVHASRIFLSCLFNALWSFPSHTKHQPITLAMRQDLLWWNTFLPLFNGVSVIKPDEWSFANLRFSTNACMVRGERLALTNASRSLSQILLSRWLLTSQRWNSLLSSLLSSSGLPSCNINGSSSHVIMKPPSPSSIQAPQEIHSCSVV